MHESAHRRATRTGLFSACIATLLACGPAPTASRPSAQASQKQADPPPVAGEATDVRLPRGVTPVAYRLSLDVDPRKDRFAGHTEIDVTLDAPRRLVILHGRNLSVAHAEIRTADGVIAATASTRKAFGQKEGEDELVLTLAREAPKGPATIAIDYSAPFALLVGLYRATVGNDAYAFTQLEAIDARRMFPCFDEPGFKTPFSISVTAPKGMIAASNGHLEHVEDLGETRRYAFATTAPIPTYLVALAVGDLDVLDGPSVPVPVRLVATHGRAKLGSTSTHVAAASIDALEKYFEIPYPFGKLDIAALPDFGPGAMENPGLVTFREDLLLTDDETPASARRRSIYVIAHELSHQWFGDLVTMQWWDDLWLNEGFATWMQAKVCDGAFAGFGAVDDRVLDKNVAMNADVLPASRAVRPSVTRSDQIYEAGGWSAYQKGASVLAMLEHYVGEDDFRAAIHAYVSKHANGSVTSPELFAALDAQEKKPISKIASSFLDQPGVPLIEVHVDCTAAAPKGHVVLKESQLTTDGADRSEKRARWSTPVCVRIEGEKGERCVVVDDTATLDVDRCPKWVEPNAGEAGYYRYALDASAKSGLTSALKELTPKERAGLIANEWALVAAGLETPGAFVDLLLAIDLPKERSRVVLQAALDTLAEAKRALVDDASMPAFVRFVHKLLDAQKSRFALPKAKEARDDEAELTRLLIWSSLYDLTDDPAIAKELEPIAHRYLESPASVDADLGALALRASARAGGASGTSLDAKRLAASRTPSERVAITVALTSKKKPDDLRASLDLFLSGDIRTGDIRHVKNGALRNRDTMEVFDAWAFSHFDDAVKKLGNAGALTNIPGRTCDESELGKITTFLEPRLATLSGAQRGYDEGVADARRCIAIRKRGASDLAKRLAKVQ